MVRSMKRLESVPTLLTKDSIHGPKNVEWAINALSKTLTLQQYGSERRPSPKQGSSKAGKEAHHSAAEELVLASRRKQGVLVLQIIRIQACVRMFVAKRQYARYREALSFVPPDTKRSTADHFSLVVSSVLLLQRTLRAYVVRRRMQRFLIAVVKVQALARATIARMRWNRIISSLVIQRWWRGAFVRYLVSLLKQSTLRLQSYFRARRTRFVYLMVRRAITKLQACVRAFIVNRTLKYILQSHISKYRDQIMILWQRASTPFSFRAQFWLYDGQSSFVFHRLVADEMKRLREDLELTVPLHEGLVADGEQLQRAQALGFSTKEWWTYVMVSLALSKQSGIFFVTHV